MHKRNGVLSPEEIEQARNDRMEKINSMHRKEKRANLRIRHMPLSRPFSRVRSGVPTGTTPHFRAWMADLSARSVLQGMKLDYLADSLTGQLASTFAILRVSGRIKNVWQLSQTSADALLSIPQIGPAQLAAVETYLNRRNVPLKWTVA